jgi:uncharacterized repeat protein (TIGR01451 family)
MNILKRCPDPFPYLLAVLSALLTWWLVSDRPPQIDTFQSPPVLSYAKTVDKHQANVYDYLSYNIIITNTGGPTTNTLVVDQLPAPVTWLGTVTST